jgi:hypothetical protein
MEIGQHKVTKYLNAITLSIVLELVDQKHQINGLNDQSTMLPKFY